VTNLGTRAIRLISAVQPHSQFRSDEIVIGRDLAPGAATEITLAVRFDEPPGSLVQNPFLIVRVREGMAEWRVLARVSASAGTHGEPIAGPAVAVTANRVRAV